mmetsp:Transcript_36410/g.97286  ORF Transcript_36410/g.97286 Transcript_36410/m.97286 type:complete len:243 (-) Transcript_36410:581-1309(-)
MGSSTPCSRSKVGSTTLRSAQLRSALIRPSSSRHPWRTDPPAAKRFLHESRCRGGRVSRWSKRRRSRFPTPFNYGTRAAMTPWTLEGTTKICFKAPLPTRRTSPEGVVPVVNRALWRHRSAATRESVSHQHVPTPRYFVATTPWQVYAPVNSAQSLVAATIRVPHWRYRCRRPAVGPSASASAHTASVWMRCRARMSPRTTQASKMPCPTCSLWRKRGPMIGRRPRRLYFRTCSSTAASICR